MEQKRVSFRVAKAIKEAGYLQEWDDCEYYYSENGELKCCDEYEGCSIEDIMYEQRYAIPAPTYLDVWLWLWREKKSAIELYCYKCGKWTVDTHGTEFNDPEEAIIATINCFVDNNLIK